jgi:hypothetical protein
MQHSVVILYKIMTTLRNVISQMRRWQLHPCGRLKPFQFHIHMAQRHFHARIAEFVKRNAPHRDRAQMNSCGMFKGTCAVVITDY